MYEKSTISHLAILSVLSVLLFLGTTTAFAQNTGINTTGPEYHISSLKSQVDNDTLTIQLIGDSVPAYTVSERFAPFRVVVDIAGATVEDSVSRVSPLIPANPIGSLSFIKLKDQQQATSRFEIEITDAHDYKVSRDGNNIAIFISPLSAVTDSQNDENRLPSITDFVVTTHPDKTRILLSGTELTTNYRVGTLPAKGKSPAQMYLDFSEISVSELVRDKNIGTSLAGIHVSPQDNGARIFFDSASPDLFAYDITSTLEGITVIIHENIHALPANLQTVAATKPDAVTDSTLDELIESSSTMLSQTQTTADVQEGPQSSLQDAFSFSGYNKQRISVDFYKIDIHNVFRLFRQITDLNIIVDEAVQGTLTLALSDVPWDFALDIILNLQDLEKEERYNTIVIYPKKKEFAWPERAEDNLSFEADVEIVEQESLIIEQSASQTKEIMQAKDILRQANIADKKENFEHAVELYEKAATLWPSNSNIYNRLSAIYLVNLGMSAKAVFYANKSLKADPRNKKAALYAAIGSANMQRTNDASEYFTRAISGNPPMKEALYSFAAFSETSSKYTAAIKLLDKYHKYYGETVDTMLAKARIYDKMGDTNKATAQYQAIMSSGFQLSPDLRDYISGRLTTGIY